MLDKSYLIGKRIDVLEEIGEICDAFEITNYDYTIENGIERLRINDTYIGCSCNSIEGVVNELIGFKSQYEIPLGGAEDGDEMAIEALGNQTQKKL